MSNLEQAVTAGPALPIKPEEEESEESSKEEEEEVKLIPKCYDTNSTRECSLIGVGEGSELLVV